MLVNMLPAWKRHGDFGQLLLFPLYHYKLALGTIYPSTPPSVVVHRGGESAGNSAARNVGNFAPRASIKEKLVLGC